MTPFEIAMLSAVVILAIIVGIQEYQITLLHETCDRHYQWLHDIQQNDIGAIETDIEYFLRRDKEIANDICELKGNNPFDKALIEEMEEN